MVVEKCQYDPIRDLQPVEPFGFIDLQSAFEQNAVPSNLPDVDSDYNGIENPESILGKPRDVFDAMAMESSIAEYESSGDKDNE